MNFVKLVGMATTFVTMSLVACAPQKPGAEKIQMGKNIKLSKTQIDPQTLALYSPDALTNFQMSKTQNQQTIATETNFETIRAAAATKFGPLLSYASRANGPATTDNSSTDNSSDVLNAAVPAANNKKIATAKAQNPPTQAPANANLWQDVSVIELIVSRDAGKMKTKLDLTLNINGQDVELSGPTDNASLVVKLKGITQVAGSNNKFANVEALALCITEECNQVLTLVKLDPITFKGVLSRAYPAKVDPSSGKQVENPRVDVHAVVDSDQQEMAIYYTQGQANVVLVSDIDTQKAARTGQRNFLNRVKGLNVPIAIGQNFQTVTINAADASANQIVLDIVDQNPNNPVACVK